MKICRDRITKAISFLALPLIRTVSQHQNPNFLVFVLQGGRELQAEQHGQQESGHLLVADTATVRIQRHG